MPPLRFCFRLRFLRRDLRRDESVLIRLHFVSVFVRLQRDLPSLDYGIARRVDLVKQVTICLRLTSGATMVARGIERGELSSEKETDYATTE